MKMLLTIVLACAAAWCIAAQPVDAIIAVQGPVEGTGTLGCDVNSTTGASCVDVYDIHCTQTSRRIQVSVSDPTCDGDHFVATLVLYVPAAMIGTADSATTVTLSCGAPTGAASVFIDKLGAQGAMRGLLTVHSVDSNTRTYAYNIQCLADPIGTPTQKKLTVEQTTDQ